MSTHLSNFHNSVSKVPNNNSSFYRCHKICLFPYNCPSCQFKFLHLISFHTSFPLVSCHTSFHLIGFYTSYQFHTSFHLVFFHTSFSVCQLWFTTSSHLVSFHTSFQFPSCKFPYKFQFLWVSIQVSDLHGKFLLFTLKYWDTLTPYHTSYLNKSIWLPVDMFKNCWKHGIQCRPRLEMSFSNVWSGSRLFAQAWLPQYICTSCFVIATLRVKNIFI